MPVFRKIPVWIVLVSYLFANTVASSWHDHRDCSGHSDGAHHDHAAGCAALDSHLAVGTQCCHHDQHHKQGREQKDHGRHACRNYEPGRNSPSRPNRQGNDGGGRHDRQHCVVCDFLALAPLSAPQATLDSAGEVLPELVVLCVLPVSGTTVETHLARGPPAV